MPFVEVQPPNVGSFTGTSGSASLPSGTTAGSTVFVAVASAGGNFITLSGFTLDSPTPASTQRAWLFRKANVGAGETSWAFAGLTSAQPTVWVAWEEDGPDLTAAVDAVPASFTSATATTVGSGTMPQTSAYDAEVYAVAVAYNSAGTTPATLSGHTNGFVEYGTGTAANATVSVRISVSRLPLASISTPSTTVTAGSSTALGATAVVYASATSKRLANVVQMAGFEWGLAPTMTGPLGATPFDAVNGSPAVVSTAPRTGSYCLELAAVAAVKNVQWNANSTGTFGNTSSPHGVVQIPVYFPGSLPSGDVDLGGVSTGSGIGFGAVLRYRASGTRLGLQLVSQSPALSSTEQFSGAVVADTWYVVDILLDVAASTWAASWQVNGVPLTALSLASVQAKLDALVLRMGSNDATPDVGVHAVLCEVAVRAGEARAVLGEAGDVQASSAVDPDSGAVLSATLTAPAGRGATLLWTGPGGAGSQPVAAGGTWTQPFADTVDSTSLVAVGMVSDPEDANRE